MRVNGEALVLAMYRQTYTQKKLAAETGLSRITVSNAVKGRPVSERTAATIAKALDMKLKDFIVLDENKGN